MPRVSLAYRVRVVLVAFALVGVLAASFSRNTSAEGKTAPPQKPLSSVAILRKATASDQVVDYPARTERFSKCELTSEIPKEILRIVNDDAGGLLLHRASPTLHLSNETPKNNATWLRGHTKLAFRLGKARSEWQYEIREAKWSTNTTSSLSTVVMQLTVNGSKFLIRATWSRAKIGRNRAGQCDELEGSILWTGPYRDTDDAKDTTDRNEASTR
ncbi:MAG: hypothetical protein AAF517_26500 [Planctomycetota bacterium]